MEAGMLLLLTARSLCLGATCATHERNGDNRIAGGGHVGSRTGAADLEHATHHSHEIGCFSIAANQHAVATLCRRNQMKCIPDLFRLSLRRRDR